MKLRHLYKIISSYVHCDGFVWGDLKIALVGRLLYLSLFSIFRWWSWQLHENTIFLFINVQYQRRQTRRLYFQKRRYVFIISWTNNELGFFSKFCRNIYFFFLLIVSLLWDLILHWSQFWCSFRLLLWENCL
jgi:hypothetical protein